MTTGICTAWKPGSSRHGRVVHLAALEDSRRAETPGRLGRGVARQCRFSWLRSLAVKRFDVHSICYHICILFAACLLGEIFAFSLVISLIVPPT